MKVRLFILSAALLLAACGRKESPAPTATPEAGEESSAGGSTILFAVNDFELTLYEDLVASFEAANPDIHVRLVSINALLELDPMSGEWPDDAWQRLVSRADVVSLDAGTEQVRQGLVRDLTPFFQADPNFQRDDFYPGVLENSQWEGGTWSLPMWVSFDLIFYDKDAFEQAGVPYPEPGWTWDDFLDKARALTIREGDEVAQWGFVQPWPNHLPFIEGRTGSLIDDTTDPPTPRLDQPEVHEAVRWYADLFLKEEVVPFFASPDEEAGLSALQGIALVENGQAAMWRESSTSWQWRQEQGNRGVAPYPVDAPDSRLAPASPQRSGAEWTTPIWPSGLSMSAGTAHPDAAWRWMDFVSRQVNENNRALLFDSRLPARRSVAESSGFWDQLDEELAQTLRYAIDHSYVTHWMTNHYIAAQNDELEAVLSGARSVDDALTQAQEQVEADIAADVARQAEATPVPTFVVVAAPEEQAAGEDTVTITFNPSVGAISNMQGYRDAARQFQEAHPGIQVEVAMPDFMSGDIGIQSMAESADCFQWTSDVQDPKDQAVILSLKPFLDADPSFTTDDFYPSLLEQFTWQGQLWSLPAELQPYVVEFNQDLFDAAGVDYPTLDWSTDDFAELAVALTQGEGDSKQYGFVPQAVELNDMLLMIARRGARLVDESADPPTFSFNNPATVEALRWYARLSTEYEAKPVFLTDLAKVTDATGFVLEQEGLISGGRAAMWTSFGPLAVAGLSDGRDELNTGVAPLPAGVDGAGGGGSAFGYFISARHGQETRQACWRWITFLTAQPDLAQGLPARRSVAESEAYRQQVGDERVAVYQASVAGVGRSSELDIFTGQSWMGSGILWLGRAYDQVVHGEASIEEALNAAQRMADDYRACVITREALADDEAQQECVLEVDPSLPGFLFNQGGE